MPGFGRAIVPVELVEIGGIVPLVGTIEDVCVVFPGAGNAIVVVFNGLVVLVGIKELY